jgi:hypothetical protein
MKKNAVFFVVLLALLSLGLTLVPHVSSQPENIKVLSYSWYIDSIGYFIVVGEVQNVGSSTVDSVALSGTVYTKDGAAQANSYTHAFVKYLIPQQKAPFYMEFPPQLSATGDLSWLSLGVDRVDFAVNAAEPTTSYQYPDLTLKDSSGTVDAEGVYWVSGTLQNVGTQTARTIRVIGTFYNASGSMVAVGYTDPLSPAALGPSGTATFRVGAFDLKQTEVPSILRISSYSLLIQTEEPVLSGTPPPPSTTTPTDTSPSPTDSSSNTNTSNPVDSTPWALYAIVAVIVVVGFAGTILVLRKRKSQAMKRRKSQVYRKQKYPKKRQS